MKKLLLLTVALAFGATASMAQSTNPLVLTTTIAEATSISVGSHTGNLDFPTGATFSNEAKHIVTYSTTSTGKEIQVAIESHHSNTWDDLTMHLDVGIPSTTGGGTRPGNPHEFTGNVVGYQIVAGIGPTSNNTRTMTYKLERDLSAAATYRGWNVTYTIL